MNMKDKFGENALEIILHPNEGSPYARSNRHPTIRSYCVNRYGTKEELENNEWSDVMDFIYRSNFHLDRNGKDEILDYDSDTDIDAIYCLIRHIDVGYNSATQELYKFRGTRLSYKDGFLSWNKNEIMYKMDITITSLLKLAMKNEFTFINYDSNGSTVFGGELKQYILEGTGSEVRKAVDSIYKTMREAQMEFNEKNAEKVAIEFLKDSGIVKGLVQEVLY